MSAFGGWRNSVCLVSKCVYLLIFQVHIVYNIKYYAIYINIMWYIDVYKIVWWDIIWINTSFQRNLFFKKNCIADFCCTLPFGIQESLGQVPYLPYFPKWTERVSTQMTTALLRFFSFFLNSSLIHYVPTTVYPLYTLGHSPDLLLLH